LSKKSKSWKYIVVIFLAAIAFVYVAYHGLTIGFLMVDVPIDSNSKQLLFERTLVKDFQGEYSSFSEPIPFKSPWGKVVSSKKTDEKVAYEFDTGVHLVFHYIGSAWYSHILLENRFTDTQAQYFQQVFGSNLTEYEIRKIILETTPADLSYFRNVKYNRMLHEILRLKGVSVMSSDCIYSFETPSQCGFQFDAPGSQSIHLEIYDDKSTMYIIVIYGNVTQDAIDFFLNNLNTSPVE